MAEIRSRQVGGAELAGLLRGEQPYLSDARIVAPSRMEDAVSATVVIYERGTKFVEHSRAAFTKKDKTIEPAVRAFGLVGKITVGGHTFDSLERMEGFVNLKAGEYPMSAMVNDGNGLGTCINPWLGARDSDADVRNLLVHAAPHAYNLKGCIAPGRLTATGSELTGSSDAITTIWEQCGGGTDRKKKIVVTLRVVGNMPLRGNCTKYPG